MYMYYLDMVESPNNATVLINQIAVFTCVTHGAPLYLYWRINGTAYNHLPSEIRVGLDTDQETVGDNEEYILTISGRVQYNGTRVQCVIGGENGETRSKIATLQILGIH